MTLREPPHAKIDNILNPGLAFAAASSRWKCSEPLFWSRRTSKSFSKKSNSSWNSSAAKERAPDHFHYKSGRGCYFTTIHSQFWGEVLRPVQWRSNSWESTSTPDVGSAPAWSESAWRTSTQTQLSVEPLRWDPPPFGALPGGWAMKR